MSYNLLVCLGDWIENKDECIQIDNTVAEIDILSSDVGWKENCRNDNFLTNQRFFTLVGEEKSTCSV